MSGRLRVLADRELCCGSGNCVRIAPEVFDQDDRDGLVVVSRPEPAPEQRDAVLAAVHTCPSGAIATFTESEGAQANQPARSG